VQVARESGRWQLSAEAPRVAADPRLMAVLRGDVPASDLAPSQVQFALLALRAAQAGRQAVSQADETRIALTV
jgi:hypothetical protein